MWKWEQQEPFGAGACNPDPDGDNVQFEFNLRFPGQYFDKESNSTYNYYRDYDSTIGRYVQSDPIGLRGGNNTFTYVRNSPLRRTDFYGLYGPAVAARVGFVIGEVGNFFLNRALIAATGATLGVLIGDAIDALNAPTLNEAPKPPVPPPALPEGWDGTTPPAPGWKWVGPDAPGGDRGGWVSPDGGQSIHPDPSHGPPIGPHVDWNDPFGGRWRLFPDGRCEPKR